MRVSHSSVPPPKCGSDVVGVDLGHVAVRHDVLEVEPLSLILGEFELEF